MRCGWVRWVLDYMMEPLARSIYRIRGWWFSIWSRGGGGRQPLSCDCVKLKPCLRLSAASHPSPPLPYSYSLFRGYRPPLRPAAQPSTVPLCSGPLLSHARSRGALFTPSRHCFLPFARASEGSEAFSLLMTMAVHRRTKPDERFVSISPRLPPSFSPRKP